MVGLSVGGAVSLFFWFNFGCGGWGLDEFVAVKGRAEARGGTMLIAFQGHRGARPARRGGQGAQEGACGAAGVLIIYDILDILDARA